MICGQCDGICSRCQAHKVVMDLSLDGAAVNVVNDEDEAEDAGNYVVVSGLLGNLKAVKECKKSKSLLRK